MNHLTDQQLLRDYAGCRSDAAFAELVRRHVDIVFSAALRMVCDAHLAEDVTQSVFVALAQNARHLTERSILSGWLHRTAQNLAANVVRSDVRRRAREQEAVIMNELHEPDADWEQIAPHLDIALEELNETDRDALLLRYFEHKSAHEMAQILGTSEDAAQKRVSRAVERLRELFSKRNVTIGAGGLVVLISANAVQAAPVGLAAAISAAAVLTGTAIQTSAVIAATKTIAMTALQKTIIGTTLAVVAGTGIFEAHQAVQLREQNQILQQQQATLAEQIRQLQQERDDATNRLASLQAENEQLKSNSNENELLKLRGEVTRLRNNAQQFENDPTVYLAFEWEAKEAKLRQLFEQRPDQRIPEMQLLSDEQWLDVAIGADLDSGRGIRLALSRVREAAVLNFAVRIQQALHTYMNANSKQMPDSPSQLSSYFRPPVDNSGVMLARYEMLSKEAQSEEAFKGASIIQKVLIDKSVDNSLIVGVGMMGFAPKPNQGHAPVDVPRELLPVLKAYMDANNHKTPLDFDELKPYITTTEQKAALEKFINIMNQ